jgi:hypothetical protein
MNKDLYERFNDVFDIGEPVWWQKPFSWILILGGVVFFVLAGIALYFFKKNKKKDPQKRIDFLLQQLSQVVPAAHNQETIYHIIVDIVQESITLHNYMPTAHLTEEELIYFLNDHESMRTLLVLKDVIKRACGSKFGGFVYPLEHVQEDIIITSLVIKKFLEPKLSA